MGLFRDGDDFADGIIEAASRLKLPPTFVEKDYWVTQVLRTLHVAFPGEFVLKGGTSLSKGYKLIDRFSEDVDILVVPHVEHSASNAATRLRAMTSGTAGGLELEWAEFRDPGYGIMASRGDTISYESRFEEVGTGTGIRHGSVLLETGFAGGHEPAEICTVKTLVGEALENSNAHEDLTAFSIRMLVPRRTLVEKCAGLHELACTWTADDPPQDMRFGRHYYDIYRLLGHQQTVEALADRTQYKVMVEDVTRISRAHFGANHAHPDGGLAESPAFKPGRDSALRAWLESGYVGAQVLITGPDKPPTFGRVLARVEEHAALFR